MIWAKRSRSIARLASPLESTHASVITASVASTISFHDFQSHSGPMAVPPQVEIKAWIGIIASTNNKLTASMRVSHIGKWASLEDFTTYNGTIFLTHHAC